MINSSGRARAPRARRLAPRGPSTRSPVKRIGDRGAGGQTASQMVAANSTETCRLGEHCHTDTARRAPVSLSFSTGE
jgi:hypothetical protein